MVPLIFRTDLHLADAPPASRTDDWTATCARKLAEVGEIARQENACAVLDGGDHFHLKSPGRNSHSLVQLDADIHAKYPCPTYGNVGNHDVKYGDMRFLDESPLGVLFSTGVFHRLYDQHEAVFTRGGVKVRVVGIPYHGTKYDMNRLTSIKKGDEDHLVVIAHLLASKSGGTMFEAEDVIRYHDLAGLAPDVWCFLPGTKVSDSSFRQHPIEHLSTNVELDGRKPTRIQEVHPVRHVDEEVVQFDVKGLPEGMMKGVTLEHPFWAAQGLSCVLPSRATRRCHPDKPKESYPCVNCDDAPQVQADWVKAGQIKVGDYVAIPVPSAEPARKALHTPSGLNRLLGLYLAEGHLILDREGQPTAGVGWSFHEDETNLHSFVEMQVKAHFGLDVKYHWNPDQHCVQVCAYGSEIAEFCYQHGGRYSDQKAMSGWVFGQSLADRLDLLTGWLEGDGHARDPAKSDRIRAEVGGATVSEDLASQMFSLALSVGLRPTLTLRPAGERVFKKGTPEEHASSEKPCWIVSFYGDDAEKLAFRMGVQLPERSKTKVSGFFHDGLYYVRVKSVRRFHYKGPVYNIRTTSEEYVAGHLLTHNCFGHWHKNQHITRISENKWVVNLGSMTRGSLTQDEMARNPAVAVMRFEKHSFDLREVPLTIVPAKEVFDLAGRARLETRETSVDSLVDSLKLSMARRPEGSLLDEVRGRGDLPPIVRERALEYLERVGTR